MLINKTLKLATQLELTIRNELRLIMVIAYKLFISESIPWKFESFAGGGQTETKKERKFPQVGLENFNEAHGVKSNPTISYN